MSEALLTPLPVPSATGLANNPVAESAESVQIGHAVDHQKVGRGQAGVTDDALGHALVQGQGHDHGVGKNERDGVGIQQGRNQGLAAETVHAFRYVEHQLPAAAGGKGVYQILGIADALGFMPVQLQSPFDGFDGLYLIKFGRGFVAVSFFQIASPQVVGHSDFHVASFMCTYG